MSRSLKKGPYVEPRLLGRVQTMNKRNEKRVLITDTTMRDAHQSLLATRMRSFDLVAVAEAYSKALPGLLSLECWGGATFDVAMRFLTEDPWERLADIREKTPNILLINNGRILAEGNVHQIRDLIDEHPHTVYIRAADPRALARRFLADDDVLSLKFEEGAIVVQTGKPDVFYTRLTALAASGEAGEVGEVASPDDNLAAVFQYLVK